MYKVIVVSINGTCHQLPDTFENYLEAFKSAIDCQKNKKINFCVIFNEIKNTQIIISDKTLNKYEKV